MQFIKIDKDFQNLLRPLTAEEFKSLEDSIKQDGCLRPVELWNGYIVDGHNRYSICMKNDIPFEQVDVTGKFETKSDVMKWIVQNQRARQTGRQLSKTELVAMADAIKKQTDKEAKEAQANAGGDRRSEEYKKSVTANLPQAKRNSTSAEKAAAAIGVSRHTYEDMKFVTEKGSEEQIERMNKGGRGNAPSAIAKEIKSKENEGTFRCSKCGKILPLSMRSKGGYRNFCKSCNNEMERKSYDQKKNHSQYEEEFRAQHNERNFKYLQMELKTVVEASVHNIMDTIKDYESREILIDEESANSIHEILSALSKIVESVKERKND